MRNHTSRFAVLALLLVACTSQPTLSVRASRKAKEQQIAGMVTFGAVAGEHVQSSMAEIAGGAVVSLIDPISGNTIASSITDTSGNFILSFGGGFTPTSGAAYILEATKGLAVGAMPNRAGANEAAVRTYLFWNAVSNGWQSLTNTTVNTGIVISPSTTAIGTIVSLKAQAGLSITLSNLIDTVNGSTGAFTDTGTGLSDTTDFLPVLADVNSAIALDQDPLADISYDSTTQAYTLAIGVPLATSVTPAIATQGGTLSVRGAYFDPTPGRDIFWFGTIPSATWSISADRTQATVSVPANAYDAPLLLEQPGAVMQVLKPMMFIHDTVGTLAGNGIARSVDGPASGAEITEPVGLAIDPLGNLWTSGPDARIRRISRAGEVSTLAGSSTSGWADGTGAAAKFASSYGVAIDPAGNAYIADSYNYRIRKITPAGAVTTIAGNGTSAWADGTGTAAEFGLPDGVAVAPDGTLYVTDGVAERIRKINPAGVVTSIAGNGTAGWADGTGTSAEFNNPTGIVLDGNGNAYVVAAEIWRFQAFREGR